MSSAPRTIEQRLDDVRHNLKQHGILVTSTDELLSVLDEAAAALRTLRDSPPAELPTYVCPGCGRGYDATPAPPDEGIATPSHAYIKQRFAEGDAKRADDGIARLLAQWRSYGWWTYNACADDLETFWRGVRDGGRVAKIELSLRLGKILGPEYDGVSLEDVARELVALKAGPDGRRAPDRSFCEAVHAETGAVCGLHPGHEQNHKGVFKHGITRDPLGPDGSKLHDDNCPLLELHNQIEQAAAALRTLRDSPLPDEGIATLRELVDRCNELRACMSDPEADMYDGNTTRAQWRHTVEKAIKWLAENELRAVRDGRRDVAASESQGERVEPKSTLETLPDAAHPADV